MGQAPTRLGGTRLEKALMADLFPMQKHDIPHMRVSVSATFARATPRSTAGPGAGGRLLFVRAGGHPRAPVDRGRRDAILVYPQNPLPNDAVSCPDPEAAA